MCFKKKGSISRDELRDSIIMLEREESYVETQIKSLVNEINLMMECGVEIKDNFDKIFLVKKIMILNEEKERLLKRALFLLYNIRLSNKLFDIMTDKEIMGRIRGLSHFDFFKDQRTLAVYLNETLQTNTDTENILTDADDAFVEVEKMFLVNSKIYSNDNINEDSLLAMFNIGVNDNSMLDKNDGTNKDE